MTAVVFWAESDGARHEDDPGPLDMGSEYSESLCSRSGTRLQNGSEAGETVSVHHRGLGLVWRATISPRSQKQSGQSARHLRS